MKLKTPFTRLLPGAARHGRKINSPESSKAARKEGKSAGGYPLIAFSGGGQASWTTANYAALAHEGYQRNAIAYRCIRMIAEASAMVPLRCYEGPIEICDHPMLGLLANPNRDQSLPDLLEHFFTYLQLSGNSYLEFIDGGDRAHELHTLRPDRMRVLVGQNGWPVGYEYTVNGQVIRHDMEGRVTPVFHMKLFHPLSDHYGQSPLESAGQGVDIHNAANIWNKTLFDNAARPSGALVYRGPDGAPHLSEEQFHRLKEELENNYQGSQNAGRPLLLEGGLEWTAISLSPQDMDFIHAKHAAAREVALAFGIPPMLLGIPGDNTYSNFAEAHRAFWRQTILPLAERAARGISKWLAPLYPETPDVVLKCNLDALPALGDERERLWQRLNKARFLTVNEKRAALGYGPVENGDHLTGPGKSAGKMAKLDH